MTAHEAGVFMRAFGDGTRLRILHLLSKRPLCVVELADILGCSVQRVWRHVDYLSQRDVLEADRAGNSVLHRIRKPRNRLHRRVLEAVVDAVGDIDEAKSDGRRVKPVASRE